MKPNISNVMVINEFLKIFPGFTEGSKIAPISKQKQVLYTVMPRGILFIVVEAQHPLIISPHYNVSLERNC